MTIISSVSYEEIEVEICDSENLTLEHCKCCCEDG